MPSFSGQATGCLRSAERWSNVHWQGEFKILYVMIISPGGPEFGKTNRNDVASYQVTQNPEIPEHKIPGCTRDRQHNGDRRGRMSECLFWTPAITPEGGPDLNLLTHRTVVESGMPVCELEEWPDDAEYLARVHAAAQSFRQKLISDQGWFQQFQRDMKQADPSWTWQGGYKIHRGPVPPPPSGKVAGISSAAAKNMPRVSEKRYEHMAEEVLASPCQNVFDKDLHSSR